MKTLIEKCLELNDKGATPPFNMEWIQKIFNKISNAQLKEELNIKSGDCHVACCFGRCHRQNGCKLNHEGIGNFNHEAYKKCLQAFINSK